MLLKQGEYEVDICLYSTSLQVYLYNIEALCSIYRQNDQEKNAAFCGILNE